MKQWKFNHPKKWKYANLPEPVKKSIGRHRRKILKKYVKFHNREMHRKHYVHRPGYGLKALRYAHRLDEKLLKKDEQEQRRQFWNH